MDGTTTNPPDNGALLNDRVAFPHASFSSDIPSAARNIVGYVDGGYKSVRVVGHGADGLIAVGGGQNPDPSQAIWTLSADQWKVALAPLRGRIWVLELLGCHVGANIGGASLLFALATLLDCRVNAPTGLMISASDGTISYEPGSRFQSSGPQFPGRGQAFQMPTPIPSPTPEEFDADLVGFQVRLVRNEQLFDLQHNSIKRVALVQPQNISQPEEMGLPQIGGSIVHTTVDAVLGRDEYHEILRYVNFSRPVKLGGAINAVKTGALQFEMLDGHTHSFTVYNNQIVQDELNPDIYYRVSPKFTTALSACRNRVPVSGHATSFIWAGPVRSKAQPTWHSKENASNPFRLGNIHNDRAIVCKVLLRSYCKGSHTAQVGTYEVGPRSAIVIPVQIDKSEQTEISVQILSTVWA